MKRALPLLLLLIVAAGPAPGAVDPFYRNRMASGVRAFDQGNWDVAARQLRIACFGHLDEPVSLVDGLVRLALAELRLGDEDAFRRVFTRLVELEERFSAYSAARLPAGLRQQFESQASRLVPAQTLASVRGFAAIAERADMEMLSALPPEQRRAELESRMQAEPDRPDWSIEMARLELETRRATAALDWLDRLPSTTIDLPPASCLRQQAASESGSCERMDLAQPFCQGVPPTVIEFRLQCLVEAARWPEAAGLIARLDPEIRARRRVTRLERRVRNNFDGTAVAPAAASPTPVAQPTSTAVATAPPATPAPPLAEPATVDPREMEGLRGRLDAASTPDELAALVGDAEALADQYPDSRSARLLAAEIAYLLSDWPAAVRHFDQAGILRFDEVHLAFYRAVALFESGDRVGAAEVLRPIASRLERNEFVDGYVDRILPPGI